MYFSISLNEKGKLYIYMFFLIVFFHLCLNDPNVSILVISTTKEFNILTPKKTDANICGKITPYQLNFRHVST